MKINTALIWSRKTAGKSVSSNLISQRLISRLDDQSAV